LKVAPLQLLDAFRGRVERPSISLSNDAFRRDTVLAEHAFQRMLTHERRRSERSRRPFVLMLLHRQDCPAETIFHQALSVITQSTRETDLVGWYKESSILGVIFAEVGGDEKSLIVEALRTKIATALKEHLGCQTAAQIAISLHIFPEDWDRHNLGWAADSKLHPDHGSRIPQKKRISLGVKRAIDVVGSGAALLLMLPILAAIALVIKLTSKGPVLFEQERLGQLGARFNCLKFRTMYTDCDAKVHQDYVQRFIAGSQDGAQEASNQSVYKITNDPRVTAIGRLLRKTSLDEFPQFWNVLRGEMSLVGPRPPLPYEFEIYEVWHRRRVFEVKPGITGLWQVSGRSRTRFDEMVRLDLRYCRSWSLWLDLKILLATPRAVLSGDGAY
jgi:lipopolysaccharide/colanic/teichoic acid biosynthesis glycosyltransferase